MLPRGLVKVGQRQVKTESLICIETKIAIMISVLNGKASRQGPRLTSFNKWAGEPDYKVSNNKNLLLVHCCGSVPFPHSVMKMQALIFSLC